MLISQMYPSRYLQAEDLPPGQNTIVTIEKITPHEARDRGGDQEPVVKWLIRFREFRKPMSLWRNNAQTIAEALGSNETNAWIGQQIAIYPSTYVAFGETKPCINVDKWRPEHSPAKVGTPGLVITGDRRPVPRAAVDRFVAHARSLGASWDGFLRWCKERSPEALALVWGVDLDSVPAGVLPAMKAFLDSLPPVAVDKTTGEVREAVPASLSTFPPSPAPVGDEDIPF